MKTPDPKQFSSGAKLADYLNSLRTTLGVQGMGQIEWLNPLDWKFEGHPTVEDRLVAVHRSDPAHKHDVTHHAIFQYVHEPLFRAIDIPPFFREVPANSRIHLGLPSYPVGTKLRLTQDARYYLGETVPAGAVVTMAGYSSTLSIHGRYPTFDFVPIAEFPDGTYRVLPRESEPLPNAA